MKNLKVWMNTLTFLVVFSATFGSVFADINICASKNLTDTNYRTVCQAICSKETLKVNTYRAGSEYQQSCQKEFPKNTTGSVCVCMK